jgi:nucleoside-diphosphate-sugar epimerase
LRDGVNDPLAEFRRVNVDASLALATQSLQLGVRRFIFISSIGVNGDQSSNEPLTEEQAPNPVTPYGISKQEAEEGLRRLLTGTGTELVILRPPLVYAATAPGNFARLLHLVKAGVPLPLASVDNRRSFLALENLLDFIERCIDHPAASGQLFVVADGEDLATSELIRCLAEGMQRPPRLWPCPESILKFAAKLSGRASTYQQLCGNLQVNIDKARRLLDWSPPLEARQALRRAGWNYVQAQVKTDGH